MRLATTLGYAGNVVDDVQRVVALEKAGLDIVWVPETWGFDAATQLGFLAARTSTVHIGAGILPIYSRTPTLIAQTAAGLDLLSGGRAILGLGSSGPQVVEGWHGVPFDRPLQRTREIVAICRQVWRRELVVHDGACYRLPLPPPTDEGLGLGLGLGKPLKLLTHPVRADIPIYLASLAPRSVELTAEVADGWLPIFYLPEKAQAVWGEALARGAARRGPGLGPLEVVAGGLCAIGEDENENVVGLREQARPQLALYVGGMGAPGKNFYTSLMARYGYQRQAEQIQALYLAGERSAAAAAVPEELLAATTLIGPASYVRERIAAYRQSGVTVLNVVPIGRTDPRRTVEQVKQMLA